MKSFSTGPSAGEALTALERKLDQIAPNRKRTDDNYSPTRGDIGPNASINVRAQADLVQLELLGTLADRQKSIIQNMR